MQSVAGVGGTPATGVVPRDRLALLATREDKRQGRQHENKDVAVPGHLFPNRAAYQTPISSRAPMPPAGTLRQH